MRIPLKFGTVAVLSALLAAPLVVAQERGEQSPSHMTPNGGGAVGGDMANMQGMMSMMQMMQMMQQMGPMMEQCTEMMAAMTEQMKSAPHGQDDNG